MLVVKLLDDKYIMTTTKVMRPPETIFLNGPAHHSAKCFCYEIVSDIRDITNVPCGKVGKGFNYRTEGLRFESLSPTNHLESNGGGGGVWT